MDNNNKELFAKLEREVWLFEQWEAAIIEPAGETQMRIKVAYQECIVSRQAKIVELQSQEKNKSAVLNLKTRPKAAKAW
jgi:UDP-3-O-acyl-N-acetylglucosamine deacetylase